MTETYNFENIEFNERALQGRVKEFKWRIREAWKNLSEAIQKNYPIQDNRTSSKYAYT